MTQKLSELTPEQQEIQRAKTKAYKAKYRSSMTPEQKAAEAKRNKEYKEKHKEEIKTWRTGYVEANRERIAEVKKEYDEKYYQQNSDKIKSRMREQEYWKRPKYIERAKKYEEENKEQLKEYRKEYYHKNREEKIAQTNKYRKENPDKVREWRKNADPVKKRISRANRRNRMRATGKLSKDLVTRLMELQKGKCRACGKLLKNDYHIDHVVPLAKGGHNVDSNCQLLHSKCNMMKSSRDPYEHAQRLGVLFM